MEHHVNWPTAMGARVLINDGWYELLPRPQGRQRGSRLDGHADFVFGMIDNRKDITLNEMVERLEAQFSMRVGRSTLSDWLRGHGWTFKKSPHMHWSRSAPTS